MASERLGDPALDKPKLKTDMCRNVDLPMGAYSINHLVSGSFYVQKLKAIEICLVL